MKNRLIILALLLCVTALTTGVSVINAEEPNVGVLHVYSVQYPRQTAPSSRTSFTIDVQYAVHENASIKASLFAGTTDHLGSELWHSEPVQVSGGGDQLWTVNLTAPASEGDWQLTAFAYYQEAGQWHYYNDTDQGPGFLEFAVKVAELTQLEVDLGVSGVQVQAGNFSAMTGKNGAITMRFPVGENVTVKVSSVVLLPNSTQMVFQGWRGGDNSTATSIHLDGDVRLVGVYRPQYLLQVNSPATTYTQATWYQPGSNVTLEVSGSVPMNWPWSSLGLRYIFKGWTGDVTSSSNKITVVMDTPKILTANFAPDLTSLILPIIVIAGVVGGVALSLARRGATKAPTEEEAVEEVAEPEETVVPTGQEPANEDTTPNESSTKFCDGCGEPVEGNWVHCIHCGKVLRGPSEPVQS